MSRRRVVSFDSASAMLRAQAAYMRGEDYPGPVGTMPVSAIVRAANHLPAGLRTWIYAWGGWLEGTAERALPSVHADELASWVVDQYPGQRAPVVMVGSSNGAVLHLAAALGAPWLPQTLLMLVRRHVDAGDAQADLEWGRRAAAPLLDANPGLHLHQMHDANQDHLMLPHAAYFRVKLGRLPAPYVQFLRRTLTPGGTIVVVDCGLRWPSARVADRHVFQTGGVGGLAPDEYGDGDHVPTADGDAPEAEWGFEPALLDDVVALAARENWHVRRLRFDHPEDVSPFVADLFRDRYAARGIEAARLVVESFALVDPYWVPRTASVPYWSVFPVHPSAQRLRDYLVATERYPELAVMLFSHGTRSDGIAGVDEWRALFRLAGSGRFLGVDEERFPQDFAALAGYHTALKALPERVGPPPPMDLGELTEHLDDADDAVVCTDVA